MGKIILFYKYVHLADPESICRWQKTLCASLGLKGRIILAKEGINGTLGGSAQALESYKIAMSIHELFHGIDFKESAGSEEYFPRLRVVVKNEVVNFGVDPEAVTVADGGVHLTPRQAHDLIAQQPDDLLILDGRNYYEARIGTFVGAITPHIENFRDFPAYINENIELFRNKRVLMFCTGGIRCERASAYLKLKSVAREVYQILGGIHRYIEEYPDGFFRGKNYVFDARIAVKVNDDILGTCDTCTIPYDEYTNCLNAMCNKQIISCPACIQDLDNTCCVKCKELVQTGATFKRLIPKKLVPENNSACSLM